MSEFGDIIICEQGFKNVVENGAINAFQLRVRISYYRGIPICLINGYDIEVDGERLPEEAVSFSLDGEKFIRMDDVGEYTELRWEFGEKAYLRVKKAGGLSRGLHTVKVTQKIDVPYLWAPTAFHQTKKLTIV